MAARMAVVPLLAAYLLAQDPAAAVRERFQTGQQALGDRRYEAAEREFEAVLEADSTIAGAHANLGVARYLQGNYPGAAESFREALALSPQMRNTELYLGLSLARAGHPEAALGSLSKGFWNASDDAWRLEGGMLLAELHAAREEEDKLVDIVRELRRAYPENPDVLYIAYRMFSDLGARAIEDLVRLAPGSARLHQVTADLLATEQDYPRAVRQYREALEINPRLPGANRSLALAILNSNPGETGQREAEQALERELLVNPQDAESLYQLGEIAWRSGQEEAALQRYRAALSARPRFVEGLTALGKALLAQGKADEAATHLEAAVEIHPDSEVARYRLAQAYRQLGRGDEAVRQLEEFRRIRSTAEALGDIYRQVQRTTVTQDELSGQGRR